MSTPLDALGSGAAEGPAVPPADEERVKRIMAELNSEATVQAPPGQQPLPRVISEPPLSTSMGQVRMDVGTARANVIGGSAPTMADFQAMFQQASPGMAPFHGPAVVQGAAVPVAPTKTSGWMDRFAAQARAPVAVAIIVFLLNLPVMTSILSRYASWMYLSSGEISVPGLLVKALLAAALFAVYQLGASVLSN
jgi:hypothetical protein